MTSQGPAFIFVFSSNLFYPFNCACLLIFIFSSVPCSLVPFFFLCSFFLTPPPLKISSINIPFLIRERRAEHGMPMW